MFRVLHQSLTSSTSRVSVQDRPQQPYGSASFFHEWAHQAHHHPVFNQNFFPLFLLLFFLNSLRFGKAWNIKKRCKTLLTLRKTSLFFLFLAFVMERGQKFLSYDNRIYIFHQILLRWRSHICKGRKTKTRGIFVFQGSE